MPFWKRKNNDPLKHLAASIMQQSDAVKPSKRYKSASKKRILKAIEETPVNEFSPLIYAIQKLAKKVSLPNGVRQSMRRRVLNYMSLDLGSFEVSALSPLVSRGAWAMAMAMVLVVLTTSIFTFNFDTPVTYAKESKIYNIDGDVYVYREGLLIGAEEGFVLQAGDKVHTGYNSQATVVFVDDTISRVAAESKLNIRAIDHDAENVLNTHVTVGVGQGRVWSKVPHLVDSSFSVATLHTVVRARKHATFDVSVEEDAIEVSVVENLVDVELSSYSPAVETTIIEGESLVVSGQDSIIVQIDERDEWLRMNLSKDEFEEKLLAQEDSEELASEVGILPSDRLYSVKMLKENLGVVLGGSEREKLVGQFEKAQQRLNEAEVLISRGLHGSAQDVLVEYEMIMLDITAQYPELIGMQEVQDQLEEIMARDKRRYHTTLPGSSLYSVKEVVEEVEVLLVNDRIRANQIVLGQSSDDLFQIFELRRHGGETLAEETLDEYVSVLDMNFADLLAYEQTDKQAYIDATFLKALEDLKTLSALEDSSDELSELDVSGTREVVLEKVQTYAELLNAEEYYAGQYDDVIAELATYTRDVEELVQFSEFTGVSEENAATVNVALDVSESEDDTE